MMCKPGDYYIYETKKLLEKVRLKDQMHHHLFELYGDKQQRVALARYWCAIDILFVDKSTANLDIEQCEVILNLLKYYNKDFKQIITMVNHKPEHIKDFDRVIRIKNGLLEKSAGFKFNKGDKIWK